MLILILLLTKHMIRMEKLILTINITLTISGFKELNQETFVSTLKEEFSKFLTSKTFSTPKNQAINLWSQEINKQNQAIALREYATSSSLNISNFWLLNDVLHHI